jgi:O-antigen ligase/Flp pilus assembly protein TadD
MRDAQPIGRSPIGWAGLWIALLVVYAVGFGGTGAGELIPGLFVVGGLLVAPLVIIYVTDLPIVGDRIDKGVLLALLAFLAACVLSRFPRQSLDSALAALVYAAGFFVARRYMADRRMRRWMTSVLVALSAALTLGTAVRWLAVAVQWSGNTGWTLIPPLNLELPSEPWGHRHDLALLVAMLYPAWWRLPPSRTQRALAIIFGLLAAFVVVIDGSRTLWGALAVATLASFGARGLRTWRRSRAIQLATLATAVVILAISVGSGFSAAVAQRLDNLSSLGFRTTMWAELFESWSKTPAFGLGPGSFPWLLQGTGYFDTNSFAPRHPDSAPLQLLAEAGLLGIVALGILLVILVPALAKGRSGLGSWAVATFVVASVASNPTDFGFVVAIAIVWTAMAVPRESHLPGLSTNHSRLVRTATLAAAGVIGIAYVANAVAAMSYLTARNLIVTGNYDSAEPSLDLAVTLDPGMALYARERGALRLADKRTDAAVPDLATATRLNPNDSVGWRILALALRSDGERTLARRALDRAIDLRRSDAGSLTLLAQWQGEDGDRAASLNTLAEIVHAWPEIVGAPGWARLLSPREMSSQEVLTAAVARWEGGQSIPETPAGQGVWLAVLANRPDILQQALGQSGYSRALWPEVVAVLRCEPATANLTTELSASGRLPLYWDLVLRNSAVPGPPDRDAEWMLSTMNGDVLWDFDARASPLNDASSTTRWGYRREPAAWPVSPPGVPSIFAGLARWLKDPSSAVEEAGLESVLPGCAGG